MRYFQPKMISLISIAIACIGLVALSSWSMPMAPGILGKFFMVTDTVPAGCDQKTKLLEAAHAQLDQIKQKLQQRDIAAELHEALQEIQLGEMQTDIDQALQDADRTLAQLDAVAVKEKLRDGLHKIDAQQISEQARIATRSIQPLIEKALRETTLQIEKAQAEIIQSQKELRKKS